MRAPQIILKRIVAWTLSASVWTGLAWAVSAAEPPARPEQKLEKFKALPPEERRLEFQKRREEFQKLTPEEREAKLKELRERMAERRKAMTPDERKVKRTEIKSRFDKQLRELEKKKANGSITAPESKRLERLGVIEQRFKQAQEHAGGIAKPATP